MAAETRETMIRRLTGIIDDIRRGANMTDVAQRIEEAAKLADEVADAEEES